MSKKLSYKGKLDMGTEDRIKLATLNGKRGYKINKFQILGTLPGATANTEYIAKITSRAESNITATVDFTDDDLLAVVYSVDNTSSAVPYSDVIIFDNTKFNQDIYVNITDASGGTTPCNYYIELETMSLNDVESTMLTLKNLRAIASR
jgi:hypothetical protein